MDFLVAFIPLLPALAGLLIGAGQFTGVLQGIRTETVTFHLASGAVYLATLLCFIVLWSGTGADYRAGTWLSSGDFNVSILLATGGPGLVLSSLFSLLFVVIFRFSRNYLHSEKGFHRFFMVLSLFAFAMYLLLLSGNAILTFAGWEIAGFCSFLLIAFAYHRKNASTQACLVFITNRVGDACFILGALLCYFWLGSMDWSEINAGIGTLEPGQVNLIALSFCLAAMVKSAQFPFTWWANRSMEGPTPSSAVFYGAVMVHAGVFLLILLSPVFSQSVAVSAFLVLVGLATLVYSALCARTQVDIKSSLGFATTGQLGIMFIECGFGMWQLALWHLCAHAVVRSYLFLTSPSILHNVHGNPVKPVPLAQPLLRRLSLESLHNFWLEETIAHTVTRPCAQLGRDLANMDDHFVDPLVGFPTAAVRSTAGFLQREERKIGARLDERDDKFSSGSGLAGKLTGWVAVISGWFEHHFVLRGVEKNLPEAGRRLGYLANSLEQALLRPRYLILFIIVSLLFAM